VQRLEQRFARELAMLAEPDRAAGVVMRPLDWVSLELIQARSPDRPIRDQFFGAVDATINPLFGYREGRRPVDGTTVAVETTHELRLAKQLVLFVHPRLQLTEGRGSTPNLNRVSLQEAYASLLFGNFSLQLGRANLVWGQGRYAGLVISPNARGLDMLKITNQEPRLLPWIFRLLGPTKGVLFFATTAADRDRHFLNSYMLGYKVTIQPFRWLELGGGYMLEAGGRGAPEASLGDRLVDHILLLSWPAKEANLQFSNKIVGVEFRATLPGGLQLYGEGAWDDVTSTALSKWFNQDSGWLVGFYAPRLTRSGRVDLSFEYQFSGIRLYRHAQFQSGLAVDERVFGNILGPEGRAGYVELNVDVTGENAIGLQWAYEGRSFDEYESPARDRRVKVRSLPQERRYRTVGSWSYRPVRHPFQFKAIAGYERVNTFDFTVGDDRGNWLGQIQLEWRF
jgi:hypothetical protein